MARERPPAVEEARARLRVRVRAHARKEGTLKPGQIGRGHQVPRATFEEVVRAAFSLHALGGAPGSGAVVWRDGTDELLLDPSKLRVATRDQFVLLAVPVFCEESGRAEVAMAFACNPARTPLGMVLATESVPRGPREVVGRWGEALVATAYGAILEALHALVDGAEGEALTLAGFGAEPAGVTLVMQRARGFRLATDRE